MALPGQASSLIGVAYLALYLILALGLLEFVRSRPARHARRTGIRRVAAPGRASQLGPALPHALHGSCRHRAGRADGLTA